MPYTCSMAGGQPVVTPGPEQSHRIIGPREQRKHRACSPVNPDMCRTWTVHRFDLDCEGLRVSWVSVVAATNEGNRRAWLLDGRLLLRMGARWSLAPDDPCAQDGSEDRPLPSGRLRRQCAERLALAPPAVVEMPFGFAPMLGIDGIFVTAAPTPPSTAKVLPPIVAGAPTAKAAGETKPLPEPQREPLREPMASEPKATTALPTPPVPVPATPSATQPAAKVAAPAPPDAATTPPASGSVAPRKVETEPKAPAPKLATAPSPASAKEAPGKEPPSAPVTSLPSACPGTPTASHGPRVVTVSPPPSTPSVSEVPRKSPPAETTPPAAGKAGPAQKAASAQEDAAPSSPPLRPAPQAKTKPEAAPSATESGVGFLTLLRPTTTGAIVAFAGLALGLLTAFALARRREHAQDVGRRRRDISTMSLDGKSGKTARSATRAAPIPASAPVQEAQPKPAKPADLMGRLALSEVADWSDRLPRTREEALEVLGIGIEPSANATALKKIVDGLRMSWHPDLAKDETDRALREHRSKQINAAWDILQTRRVEA